MKNIVVRDTHAFERWEFIQTHAIGRGTTLRLHSFGGLAGARWALTAVPHMRRPEGDYEKKGVRVPWGEEPNTVSMPEPPNHIIAKALELNPGAVYKPWPIESVAEVVAPPQMMATPTAQETTP